MLPAMTGALIAPSLSQNWYDFARETDGHVRLRALHVHGHLCFFATDFNCQERIAIAGRMHDPIGLDRRDIGSGRAELRIPGQVFMSEV